MRSLAISSDGRKLFVTAPGSPNSQIVVINIDPKNRPHDPNQNPHHWHEMIGTVQVGAGSEGISATSDPLKMTYANSRGDNKGFGLLSVTNDDPNAFVAEVKEVPLGLGSTLDYFDVNEGVSVAVTRDGSYGFVVGRNADPRFFGQEMESVEGVQAGSNIGIIKDPLTNPKLVAATRPIPDGFATDLVLSNDNKYLYASYPTLSGGGGVYVFDVEEIIRTLENPEDFQIDHLDRGIKSPYLNPFSLGNVSFSKFQSVPIDDINPAISIAADYGIVTGNWAANQFTYGVLDEKHSPIATGGSPSGMAASLVITQTPREEVQEFSRKIALDLRNRDIADNDRDKARIDTNIRRHQKKRKNDLLEFVLETQAGNQIEVIDGEKGIYGILMEAESDLQLFYGTSSVLWNLSPVSPSVFSIGKDIASKPENVFLPAGTKLTTRLGLGGSAIQGRVQPYPGDIDFSEQFTIKAPNSDSAAKAVANTIIEFARRSRELPDPDFEFQKIIISTLDDGIDGRGRRKRFFTFEELTDITKYDKLVLAVKNLDYESGNINTFWRAKVDGNRFINISKILDISAKSSTGKQ